MKYKRFLIFTYILLNIFNLVVFSVFTPEKNIIADRIVHQISHGLKYIKSVEVCDGIRQEIFSFEYTPNSQTEIRTAYGRYIYGFNSVGSLISSFNEDERIVGGINTDFFITNTGVPLSCLVSDGEIISSCDGRIAIGFDENGNAVIGNPQITCELVFFEEERSIPVAHINKTPAIWGVYLVTDKFSRTTKTSLNSIEIVLKPVSDYDDITYDNEGDAGESESEDLIDISNSMTDERNLENDNIHNIAVFEESQLKTYVDTNESSDIMENIVDSEDDSLKEYLPLNLGSTVKTVVEEIRYNSVNGEIPEGCFVACIPSDNFGYVADGIQVGDKILVETSYNNIFNESVNIFGAGTRIVENGIFLEQADDSVFKYKHPRTAAGIKEDGTVLFVCVDGRNPGVSSGYTVKELADYLISNGCIEAVNFDGGGSTTFYAADIGEVYSNLKNNPSGGYERKIADGLVFVNKSEPTGEMFTASLYPSNYYVYNNATVEISDNLLYADTSFYPAEFLSEDYYITVDDEFGFIDGNVFVPSGKTGSSPIFIKDKENDKEYEIGSVFVTDTVDRIDLKIDNLYLSPFDDKVTFSLEVFLNTIPVTISNNSAEFSVFKKSFSGNGEEILFTSVLANDYINIEEYSFTPIERDLLYRIQVDIGGMTESFDIFAEKYPFDDMVDHWGNRTAYDMFKKDYFIGEIVDDIRLFYPERNMTYAEFCVVLSRILDLDKEYASFDVTVHENGELESENVFDNSNENIIDVIEMETLFDNVPDWASDGILSLYNAGYIDSLIDSSDDNIKVFDHTKIITRMDVIRILGNILIDKGYGDLEFDYDKNLFSDFIPDDESDLISVYLLHHYSVLKGYEDGTIRQDLCITRAEAATIFSRLCDFLYNE